MKIFNIETKKGFRIDIYMRFPHSIWWGILTIILILLSLFDYMNIVSKGVLQLFVITFIIFLYKGIFSCETYWRNKK